MTNLFCLGLGKEEDKREKRVFPYYDFFPMNVSRFETRGSLSDHSFN